MGNLTRISGSLIANYSSSITGTGSFGSLAVSDKVQGTLTLNSNITGSSTSTGSFGKLEGDGGGITLADSNQIKFGSGDDGNIKHIMNCEKHPEYEFINGD